MGKKDDSVPVAAEENLPMMASFEEDADEGFENTDGEMTMHAARAWWVRGGPGIAETVGNPTDARRADADQQPPHQRTREAPESGQLETGVLDQHWTFETLPRHPRLAPHDFFEVEGLELR